MGIVRFRGEGSTIGGNSASHYLTRHQPRCDECMAAIVLWQSIILAIWTQDCAVRLAGIRLDYIRELRGEVGVEEASQRPRVLGVSMAIRCP